MSRLPGRRTMRPLPRSVGESGCGGRREPHCSSSKGGHMRRLICSVVALTVLAAIPAIAADITRYSLPPGNFGGPTVGGKPYALSRRGSTFRVQADGDVEDVVVARSLRISRNTGANITAGCDASITGFTATLEDTLEMYSVRLSNQGIVKNNRRRKTGDLHVCLGPTAAGPTVWNFWTDGTLTGVSFHAIGTCTEKLTNYPEVGLRTFNCYQDLKNLSGGYIGGTFTTNTISSLQLFGEESDPPGYTQASIATVRLWKPRQ